MQGDNISTVGNNISTVEGYLQCCERITVVHVGGIASVHWGIPSVLWRLFSTVGNNISTVGIASVLWRVFSTLGDNISTCGG